MFYHAENIGHSISEEAERNKKTLLPRKIV